MNSLMAVVMSIFAVESNSPTKGDIDADGILKMGLYEQKTIAQSLVSRVTSQHNKAKKKNSSEKIMSSTVVGNIPSMYTTSNPYNIVTKKYCLVSGSLSGCYTSNIDNETHYIVTKAINPFVKKENKMINYILEAMRDTRAKNLGVVVENNKLLSGVEGAPPMLVQSIIKEDLQLNNGDIVLLSELDSAAVKFIKNQLDANCEEGYFYKCDDETGVCGCSENFEMLDELKDDSDAENAANEAIDCLGDLEYNVVTEQCEQGEPPEDKCNNVTEMIAWDNENKIWYCRPIEKPENCVDDWITPPGATNPDADLDADPPESCCSNYEMPLWVNSDISGEGWACYADYSQEPVCDACSKSFFDTNTHSWTCVPYSSIGCSDCEKLVIDYNEGTCNPVCVRDENQINKHGCGLLYIYKKGE